ncbi:MAG: LysM peptidoglycan-binding domain-containing protein [Anaerolineales bacterium]|nr:LysM peptidoglycan-binding domain-containing protein [Anaerolineales bacterium]
MKNIFRTLVLAVIIVSALTSCSLFNTAEANTAQATPALPAVVTIELTVQADTSVPFNTVGQTIKYNYNVKNIGTILTAGPVIITGAACPEINTVGNLDASLDVNETITCTSAYTITQTDLDKGSVVTITTASVNGINSNQVTTTVATVPPVILKLTKTANPLNYDHVGQSITYAYVITNSGAATLGPAQFTISDTGLSAPINCGEATLTLASNVTVTCSATYTISQADMDAGSVSTNATASGGGVAPSQPATAAITKGAAVPSNTNPANLTVGSTIKHQVVTGEWLWQIARCYGTDPTKLLQANPQLVNPAQITPNATITVPNIGSVGKIYGPPCVGTHTVQSGDTWNSIALKYNADATVLKMVNPTSTLAVGSTVKVPLNSAGATTSTGSAGNCADLTRTVKLAGVSAATTHFNICGTTDSSGKTKIFSINISQRVEDVGQGGLLQDITVLIETSTPLNDANSLIVADMNYDGNDDFRIVKLQPASANIPYLYYIYDPATRKFIYNEAYANITSPEFPGNFEIRSKWRESAAKSGIDTYVITNNTPRLSKRETWEAINETQATHLVTVYNADGTSQVTVNETVPLPIP